MTKKELLEILADAPDEAEIRCYDDPAYTFAVVEASLQEDKIYIRYEEEYY